MDNETKGRVERLQKYLSACGVASRRRAEELIAGGHVQVNGTTAVIGQSVRPGRDKVAVDGKPVRPPRRMVYIALNKPRGYVTTLHDELGRRCVTELIGELDKRVYPVGRLDRDSEGLLLLTDDGAFANFLTHPKNHVPKVYHVSVRPAATDAQIAQLESGIELDGRLTAPAKVRVVSEEPDRSVLDITLFEGRNRQVRRMCEALGFTVARLSRIAVGSLKLGGLRPGQWRELTPREVGSLRRASGMTVRAGEQEDDDA